MLNCFYSNVTMPRRGRLLGDSHLTITTHYIKIHQNSCLTGGVGFHIIRVRMKKELGIAIFIGILLGFGLSAFFWARNKDNMPLNLAGSQPTPTEAENQPTAVPTSTDASEEITLTVTQPENEIISDTEDLTIKGETQPNATVVVIWEEGEDILVADKDGKFETEIELVGGENEINISAYDNQGNKSAQTLTVTYSTAKF